jgi:hypothetical protein
MITKADFGTDVKEPFKLTSLPLIFLTIAIHSSLLGRGGQFKSASLLLGLAFHVSWIIRLIFWSQKINFANG